jgi:hypothetical protein
MKEELRKIGAKLIGAKVEIEYYEGLALGDKPHLCRAVTDIDNALELLIEIEEGDLT